MDKSGEAALILRLHRHHEAPVTLGDQRFLQHLGIGGRGDDALQNLPRLGSGGTHLAADIRQLAAGGIGDSVLIEDGGADLLLQIFVGMEGGEQAVDDRGLALALQIVFIHAAAGGQHTGNIQQFTGVQHTAVVGAVQWLRHILHTGERGAAVESQPRFGGIGLVQQAHHFLRLRAGHQLGAALLGGIADRLMAEHLQHGRQLQCADGFFKHFAHSSFFPIQTCIGRMDL